MEKDIFIFVEQDSILQRFTKVFLEAYQEFSSNPKKFTSSLLSKDSSLVNRRQYLKIGLSGAIFLWLLGIIIYTAFYFIRPTQETLEDSQHQVLTMLTALPPTITLKPSPSKEAHKAQGGGGSGTHAMSAPTNGQLPKAEFNSNPMIATARTPTIKNPSLPLLPTINVQEDLVKHIDNSIPLGLPTGIEGLTSGGSGSGGSFGNGNGSGIGSGIGDGYGPGIGGNTGNGHNHLETGEEIYTSKMGIVNPTIVYKQKPLYTEEARRNKIQGDVVLSVILRKDGSIMDIKVVRGLGYGLDEEAIKAASRIRFIPGSKNGQAVNVKARLEFSFQLL
jgi:TonB family protein